MATKLNKYLFLIIFTYSSCTISRKCKSIMVYEYVKENFVGNGDTVFRVFPPFDNTHISVNGNIFTIKATAEYRNANARVVYYHLDYDIKCENGRLSILRMDGVLE